jgi:hypothetical protein
VAGSGECSDEPSNSGATELVTSSERNHYRVGMSERMVPTVSQFNTIHIPSL